jgi:hypothetical protein
MGTGALKKESNGLQERYRRNGIKRIEIFNLSYKKQKMKNLLVLLLCLSLVSCAEVEPQQAELITEDAYGFFGGLWHGAIVVVSFFASIFDDQVVLYSVNNTGFGYNLGFVLGSGLLGAGTSKAI